MVFRFLLNNFRIIGTAPSSVQTESFLLGKIDHLDCFFFAKISPNLCFLENGMTVFEISHSKLHLFDKWTAFLEKKAVQIEKTGEMDCLVILRFRFFFYNRIF